MRCGKLMRDPVRRTAVLFALLLLPGVLRADAKYYRYSDDRPILYFRGDDLKLIVFMIVRLTDM